MKKGQTCAAFVIYPEHNKYAWIITKIDKRLPGKQHKYQVRDEYYTDPKHELYIVDEKRVTPFPTINGKYRVGEKILAMWHDEQSNEWSTMLYVAVIIEKKGTNKLIIRYQGSDELIEIGVNYVAKFPPDFDLSVDNNDDETSEKEANDSNDPEEENPTTEKIEKDQINEKEVTEQEEDKKKETPEKKKDEEEQENNSTDIQEDHEHEQRRIRFMFNEPAPVEKMEIQCLKDEDFTELAGPPTPPVRMHTVKGTPLLDSLEDPELFSQEFYSHITGSGKLSAPKIKSTGKSFINQHSNIKCGRLSLILGEWSNSHT